MKDARCRTADLAQVRSAPPHLQAHASSPVRQAWREARWHGKECGSMVSHECGKVIKYEQPTTPTIKAPAPPRGRGIAKRLEN
ncbi:hypothetical protein GW17_00015280 [Ensete ventricosum]|nr:hypothetical protein GW17_00015280 [Ensete ventricosum]